jgi:hypothetical protein
MGWLEGDGGSDITNVQSGAIQNCHNRYSPVQWICANKKNKK